MADNKTFVTKLNILDMSAFKAIECFSIYRTTLGGQFLQTKCDWSVMKENYQSETHDLNLCDPASLH